MGIATFKMIYISHINACIYSYSKVISKIMNETSSGSFCLNDSVLQSVMVGMPFGGVGETLKKKNILLQHVKKSSSANTICLRV